MKEAGISFRPRSFSTSSYFSQFLKFASVELAPTCGSRSKGLDCRWCIGVYTVA